MKDLLNAVDAVALQTVNAKYTPRVRGEEIDEPPVSTTVLANRARRWMVSKEWLGLSENKKYDTPNRIVNGGKCWGDDEDPEVEEAERKRVKVERGELRLAKKVRLYEPQVIEASMSKHPADEDDDLYE